MSLANLLGDLPVPLASNAPGSAAEEQPMYLEDGPAPRRRVRKSMDRTGCVGRLWLSWECRQLVYVLNRLSL